jgi:hypothetical protein
VWCSQIGDHPQEGSTQIQFKNKYESLFFKLKKSFLHFFPPKIGNCVPSLHFKTHFAFGENILFRLKNAKNLPPTFFSFQILHEFLKIFQLV